MTKNEVQKAKLKLRVATEKTLKERDQLREKHSNKLEKNKLTKKRFIRDPIHDIIEIEHPIVEEILNSEPVQRLRRIKQLGMASMVYPGAEHSRLAHSLGVYHLAGRVLNKIHEDDHIWYYERLVVQLAALLHDTGHGPYSHLFESVLKEVKYKHKSKHEDWTKKIIMKHPQIQKALKPIKGLAQDITDVISESFQPKYLASIISSQFDVDRFDYMLRDSHMTGVNYGRFDVNWIIRNIRKSNLTTPTESKKGAEPDEVITVDALRGLNSLDQYILGNWYLYHHVYYHRTVQAADWMLIKALRRCIDCYRQSDKSANPEELRKNLDLHPALEAIAKNEELSLTEYMSLDDSSVIGWLKHWSEHSKDKILKDLSDRILHRKFFKTIEIDPGTLLDKIVEIKERLISDDLDPTYYCIVADPSRATYKLIDGDEIHLVDDKQEIKQYSKYAAEQNLDISKTLANQTEFKKYYLIVPEEYKSLVK